MEKLGKHGARLKDLRRRVKRRPDGQVIVDGRRLVADVVRWAFRSSSSTSPREQSDPDKSSRRRPRSSPLIPRCSTNSATASIRRVSSPWWPIPNGRRGRRVKGSLSGSIRFRIQATSAPSCDRPLPSAPALYSFLRVAPIPTTTPQCAAPPARSSGCRSLATSRSPGHGTK